jgi:hypothetical protein
MSSPKMTTRDFSLVVGQTAITAIPAGGAPGMHLSFMRIWNVSASATVWCSRAGAAVVGAAGSFPLGPGLYELYTFPQTIPVNALSLIATAAGTPVTIEVG